MPRAHVEVRVEPGEPSDEGADIVTFLLAANPGESPRPLARAASGGELARTMLALRLVTSDAPPTLVFDEVDAGIGGEAGTAVGRRLATLGATHQVVCVTHLAQVAAHAGHQIVVEKAERGGRIVATATAVDGPARERELSRMLAGVEESDHARRHAAELLARVEAGQP
jgi:DNA repair protein RecN (Recombination protein N)